MELSKKKILIIDDDAAFRDSLERVLRRAGYETQGIEDGSVALTLHRKEGFDLIITDLIMPGKEGLEIIVELHKVEPRLKIIAVSGEGESYNATYLSLAKKLGAVATLRKPFIVNDVLDVISNQICPNRTQ